VRAARCRCSSDVPPRCPRIHCPFHLAILRAHWSVYVCALSTRERGHPPPCPESCIYVSQPHISSERSPHSHLCTTPRHAGAQGLDLSLLDPQFEQFPTRSASGDDTAFFSGRHQAEQPLPPSNFTSPLHNQFTGRNPVEPFCEVNSGASSKMIVLRSAMMQDHSGPPGAAHALQPLLFGDTSALVHVVVVVHATLFQGTAPLSAQPCNGCARAHPPDHPSTCLRNTTSCRPVRA
jgi:hypothetical protein